MDRMRIFNADYPWFREDLEQGVMGRFHGVKVAGCCDWLPVPNG